MWGDKTREENKQEDKNQNWGNHPPKKGKGNFQDYEKRKA